MRLRREGHCLTTTTVGTHSLPLPHRRRSPSELEFHLRGRSWQVDHVDEDAAKALGYRFDGIPERVGLGGSSTL